MQLRIHKISPRLIVKVERNVSRQIPSKAKRTPRVVRLDGSLCFKKLCTTGTNTDTIPTRNPALEAVVYFIPGTRKANTPNRSSPRILPYPRVRRFISFIFGKKTSATVINAMQKRSAIIENGGIPVSPIFIRRYEQPQVMATMAIRISACPVTALFSL